MNKTKSFVDSSILRAGWRGITVLRIKSLTILSEAEREFVSSPFVRLEVKPKAVFHKNADETAFYAAFFENVDEWIDDLKKIVSEAESLAEKYGLNGMDALHIAAAIIAEADEFITAERSTSPLSQVKEVKIVSIN
ncbi:MAG TPA: PIN domain-containing protein [Pyrinomonadaceae bacterium]|jgi:hypothetical protein